MFLFSTYVMFGVLCPIRLNRSVQAGSETLRIVSINIFSYETNLEECARRVRQLSPDIIAFQEVWMRDHLKILEKSFPAYDFIGTRRDSDIEMYFVDGVFLAVRKGGAYRIAQRFDAQKAAGVVLYSAQRRFAVIAIHGSKAEDWSIRGVRETCKLQRVQAEDLVRLTERLSLPWLVAGDFNAPLSGPALKVLDGHSAFLQTGTGTNLTFPSRLPVIGIDHLIGSRNIEFQNFEKLKLGSDHLGLLSDFKLSQESLSTHLSSSGSRRHSD